MEPQQNPELLGQANPEQALLDGALSGRLAHAWLLTGSRGAGKATLAYRFARFLLVSHAPGRLLATIRSRGRRLDVKPLPAAMVLELLSRRTRELNAADRDMVAGLAEGSIGRALALAEAGGVDLYRDLSELLLPL